MGGRENKGLALSVYNSDHSQACETMDIRVESRQLGDVCVLVPQVFQDDHEFFTEVFRAGLFKALGLPTEFVQDNHSGSVRGVLRGLLWRHNDYIAQGLFPPRSWCRDGLSDSVATDRSFGSQHIRTLRIPAGSGPYPIKQQ